MTVGIDDTPPHLTVLLFARHVWGIAADAEVPRLDPVPDAGSSGLPGSADNAERECRPRADWHARTRFGNADELPEPQSLPALIAAWEGGLDTVIVLPNEGYFARRVPQRHLAVSAATRSDPVSYGRALGTAPVTGGSGG